MYRTSNDLRQVFLRLKKQGKGLIEISDTIGVSRQSLWTWSKMTDEELMKIGNKSTRQPSIDLENLQKYYLENPYKFDWEVGLVFGVAKSTIQKWREKLKITRKVTTKSYKEANPELKKTL
jgi:Transposase